MEMKIVRIYETVKGTDLRLTLTNPTLNSKNVSDIKEIIHIDKNRSYQEMVGFGGAFTEAASYTLSKMSEENRSKVIEAYFDRDKGLNYSIGRIPIHSCDFALGNYTYIEEGDSELKTFDISHERKWTIPLIKEASAKRGQPIQLLASPWSPPAFMKDTKEMNNGGKLLPEYFESWANYYVRFIKEMEKEGLDIFAITVQNEPAAVQTWDSCIYSPEEERDFIKDYLGPKLHGTGLSRTKLFIWDHNRDLVVERATKVLEDPIANKYVYGTGIHWYVSEEFENLSIVHDAFPDKHILFTEGCQEGGVHLGSWLTGERYGRNMIGDMNNWCEGYLDWNIVLDETGGPNHVGNLCDAPIIADTQNDVLHFNSSYYYIGHFSKFVMPKARRIHSDNASDILTVSFKNPDGSIVTILQNELEIAEVVKLICDKKETVVVVKPRSIMTLIEDGGNVC